MKSFCRTTIVSKPNQSLQPLAIKILFALVYESTMPVAKRQARTAKQKWYAIELKR
jgi:hypothetical protein